MSGLVGWGGGMMILKMCHKEASFYIKESLNFCRGASRKYYEYGELWERTQVV